MTVLGTGTETAAESLTLAGADLLVQSALLVGVGLAAARLVKRRGAAVESLVLRATLVAVLACPVASALLGAANLQWGVGDAEVLGRTRQTVRQLLASEPPAERAQSTFEARPAGGIVQEPPASVAPRAPVPPSLYRRLAGVWLAVMGVMLARLLLAHGHLARIRRRAPAAPARCVDLGENLAARLDVAAVDLRVSPRVQGPCLVGFFHPSILLPPDYLEDEAGLRLVLIHELAHQIRHDTAWNFLCRLARATIFFNPLVWRLTRRLEESGDEVADDFVVEYGHDPQTYATRLVKSAARPLGRFERAAGAGVVAFQSALGRRVQRVLKGGVRAVHSARRHKAAAVIAAACAVVVAGVVSITSADAGAATGGKVAVKGMAGGFDTIQAAIDAAPPGGVVQVPAGVFPESLTVTKPVALQGAGWEKTVVARENRIARLMQEMADNVKSARSDEERKQVVDEARRQIKAEAKKVTALNVAGTAGVSVRGMKFTSPGPSIEGQLLRDITVVEFTDAQVRMEDCAVVAGPGCGIQVGGQSDVEISRTLVAAVWATGVTAGDKTAASKLRLTDSEVRNCYYAGVRIAPRTDVVIDRCRVSGAAWHGVRYDYASPTISGCLIWGNARSGIYASGQTAATITGNIFYNNAMNGMSCWFQNKDTIRNNTFDGNPREALSVLGGSEPDIANNVFTSHLTAVRVAPINTNDAHSRPTGKMNLQQNLFWNNDQNLLMFNEEELELPLPPANIDAEESPFAAPADPGWTLRKDSAAAQQDIGAQTPLALESPWPLQPEELAIVPDDGTRDSKKWKRTGAV